MLVRGSNYVRMDMGKLLFNKKIITVTDACVLWVKTCCWRVCSTFYDQNID